MREKYPKEMERLNPEGPTTNPKREEVANQVLIEAYSCGVTDLMNVDIKYVDARVNGTEKEYYENILESVKKD